VIKIYLNNYHEYFSSLFSISVKMYGIQYGDKSFYL
jgi:hypothetical protein